MTVTARIFDDSCFLETSTDLGTNWIESATPDDTLGDAWTDLQMAILDEDFATMVAFDGRYLGSVYASILAISFTGGGTGSWTYINPSNPGADGTAAHPQVFYSGAISGGGDIILALPTKPSDVGGNWPDLTLSYPRISRDHGATWTDITDLGSGRFWLRACFNKGADTMYMVAQNSFVSSDPSAATISKSTDGGNTWIDLAGPPYLAGTIGGERQQRLRCSSDGSVVLYVDNVGDLFLSKDFGGSWTAINSFNGYPPDFNPITVLPDQIQESGSADCGVSADGKIMLVTFGDARFAGTFDIIPSYVVLSTDGGDSWARITPPGSLTNSGHNTSANCNVSLDGKQLVIAYQDFFINPFPDPPDPLDYQADISVDGGATWTNSQVTPSLAHGDGYVTAYIIGPPPVPLKGGYIIERLDNRIWPTVEDCWCIDCGFTLPRPQPSADIQMSTATGAGICTGVTGLVGGTGYSASTTADVVDDNGLGSGTGAIAVLTIVAGVITAIAFSPGGTGYVFPQLVFNDPENTGSGASATITLDNSAMFITNAPVFVSGDVGSVIRCGYGIAVITAFLDSEHVTANILSPIAQVKTDDPISPDTPITFLSGTWTMTKPISSFYLPQLAGFEITGLADGQIIPPTIIPDNGIVTLAQPASAIIVGLAFQAQLQSTYLDAGEPTVQGQRKKIAEVTVRVEQSAAFQVGANQPDGSTQSPQELAPLWQDMVDAPTPAVPPFNNPATPLFTGDIRVPIGSGFNTKGQVAVQQLNPLPLQVLDYVPEVLSGDKPAQEAPPRPRGKGGGGGGNQQQ